MTKRRQKLKTQRSLFAESVCNQQKRKTRTRRESNKPNHSKMGAANSYRKLTIDCVALLEQLEPNKGEVRAKTCIRAQVQHILEQQWPSCRVIPFGSSENGFGTGGSDLDLGIYFTDVDVGGQGNFAQQEKAQILIKACALLYTHFEVKQFVPNARVPILKLWSPKYQVACDICVGSVHALLNTALLRYYGHIDPRVRPLVIAVKHWAKARGINDSVNGTLSSYAWTMLAIFFLQSRHAKQLLPCVQPLFHAVHEQKSVYSLLQFLECLPDLEASSTFGLAADETIGGLLSGFFEYYASVFNMEDEVVSIRTGMSLSKVTKWSRPVHWRLSIEDPFELMHDVARVIFNKRGQEIINEEFRRASEILATGGRLEDVCRSDDTAWNINSSCYICCGTDHNARNCCYLITRIDVSAGHGRHSSLVDCWYCGEHGHFKSMCPLAWYQNIPREGYASVNVHPSSPPLLKALSQTNEGESFNSLQSTPPSPRQKRRKRQRMHFQGQKHDQYMDRSSGLPMSTTQKRMVMSTPCSAVGQSLVEASVEISSNIVCPT